jgi:Uma2 family endonuclease
MWLTSSALVRGILARLSIYCGAWYDHRMNDFEPHLRATTQTAEGLPRWRWTVADLDRFVQFGLISEDDRVELLGGELVPMASKGPLHEDLRSALNSWFRRRLPDEVECVSELGWRPDVHNYCEPDFVLHERVKSPSRMAPDKVILLIEVSDSSEKKDLETKAALYASLGVREYWTIRAASRETRVHRLPGPDGYADIVEVPGTGYLQPAQLPMVNIRLDDFDLM